MPSVESGQATIAQGGLRMQVVDNQRVWNGEFSGVADVRIPGRSQPFPIRLWNLEHVFDGHQFWLGEEGPENLTYEPRLQETPLRVLPVSPHRSVLYQPALPHWGFESASVITVVDERTFDVEFCGRFVRPGAKGDWMGLFWAAYPQRPDAPLFFVGRQTPETPVRWIEGRADKHGVMNTWTLEGKRGETRFVDGYPSRLWTKLAEGTELWTHPVAYGALDERTTFGMMFQSEHQLRLTQSPLSAWDVQLLSFDWAVDRPIRLRGRFVVGPLSPADVVAAYESWSGEDVPQLGPAVGSITTP